MISIALYEPEIPPNTGNIARLCAGADIPLHIVGKASFSMDDRAVRRAGLDYWPHVQISHHENLEALSAQLASAQPPAPRIICLTTKAQRRYTDWIYQPGDCLLFGPETRGLPAAVLEAHPQSCLTIPMKNPHVRSLNLSNAVSIVMYEALRQLNHFGPGHPGTP